VGILGVDVDVFEQMIPHERVIALRVIARNACNMPQQQLISNNVYGAVIMTKVIARVHPVHLMNAD